MAPGRILVIAGSCGRRGVWPTPRSSTALTAGFACRAAGSSASTWPARSTNRCITRAVRRSASPPPIGLRLERRFAHASRIGVGDVAAEALAAQAEHEAVLGLGVQIDAHAVDLADGGGERGDQRAVELGRDASGAPIDDPAGGVDGGEVAARRDLIGGRDRGRGRAPRARLDRPRRRAGRSRTARGDRGRCRE